MRWSLGDRVEWDATGNRVLTGTIVYIDIDLKGTGVLYVVSDDANPRDRWCLRPENLRIPHRNLQRVR
jgi:hypothetical protein